MIEVLFWSVVILLVLSGVLTRIIFDKNSKIKILEVEKVYFKERFHEALDATASHMRTVSEQVRRIECLQECVDAYEMACRSSVEKIFEAVENVMSPSEVMDVLIEKHGVDMSRRKIDENAKD
jgi:hypothetical protein